MYNESLTFNDLPQVVAQLRDEVMGMKVALLNLQNGTTQQKQEDRHKPMSPQEVADYTGIPLGTIYQKLSKGDIPGIKSGKRWLLLPGEIDRWLETQRKNEVPMTAEELNASFMNSHRRKPKSAERYG